MTTATSTATQYEPVKPTSAAALPEKKSAAISRLASTSSPILLQPVSQHDIAHSIKVAVDIVRNAKVSFDTSIKKSPSSLESAETASPMKELALTSSEDMMTTPMKAASAGNVRTKTITVPDGPRVLPAAASVQTTTTGQSDIAAPPQASTDNADTVQFLAAENTAPKPSTDAVEVHHKRNEQPRPTTPNNGGSGSDNSDKAAGIDKASHVPRTPAIKSAKPSSAKPLLSAAAQAVVTPSASPVPKATYWAVYRRRARGARCRAQDKKDSKRGKIANRNEEEKEEGATTEVDNKDEDDGRVEQSGGGGGDV
jgi:hypothetical protein